MGSYSSLNSSRTWNPFLPLPVCARSQHRSAAVVVVPYRLSSVNPGSQSRRTTMPSKSDILSSFIAICASSRLRYSTNPKLHHHHHHPLSAAGSYPHGLIELRSSPITICLTRPAAPKNSKHCTTASDHAIVSEFDLCWFGGVGGTCSSVV